MRFRMNRILICFILIIFSNLKINSQYINGASFSLTGKYIINDNALVIGDGLRVRKDGNIKSAIVDKLKFGDIVKVLEVKYSADKENEVTNVNGIKNFWWKVETEKGIRGYVFAEYLAYPYYKIDDENYLYVKWEVKEEGYKHNKERLYIPILIYKNKSNEIKYQLSFSLYDKYNSKNEDSIIYHNYTDTSYYRTFFILEPINIEISKIRKGLFTFKIKSQWKTVLFDSDGGPYHKGNIWYKYENNKINAIYQDIADIQGLVGWNSSPFTEYLRDSNNNINEIKFYIDYIFKYIKYDDFNDILNRINSEEKKFLMKCYNQIYYNYNIKECFTSFQLDELFEVITNSKINEEEKYNLKQIISKYYDFLEQINNNKLSENESKFLKNIFYQINYNPGYGLVKDLKTEDLKKLNSIFIRLNLKSNSNKFTLNKWNGKYYENLGEKN